MLVLHTGLTLLVLVIGLILPGWLLALLSRTSVGLVGAFLGSAAILLNLILLLDVLGLALDRLHLATGLALICALLALLAARRSLPITPSAGSPTPDALAPTPGSRIPFRWAAHQWFFVPVVVALTAVVLRATLEPLSGFDTIFRWNFLALQMFREGSLHFYPAVTAQDFLLYGWPDGIAPLVSSLYLWSYLSAGHTAAWVTAPVVVGQAALLFFVVWQLAARADRRAGALACAVLATSSVLLWGVAMGQETGLTALSLVAMFLFLERHLAEPGSRWLVWAGVAAGVGALAREYALAYLAFGTIALAWWRVPPRRWLEFLLAAAIVAFPWYIRNWIKTGNPLYAQELGGLFPGNPVLAEYNHLVAAEYGFGSARSTWPKLAGYAFGLAGIPLILSLIAGATRWRARAPWLIAGATIFALWLWSLAQTSAGPNYAVRVLTPAISLGAVLGGVWLASALPARATWPLLAVLTLASFDAGMRSFYLPILPTARWWESPPLAWLEFAADSAAWHANPTWTALADAAKPRGIIAPHPVPYAVLNRLGATTIPLFSPAIRFLFDPDANYEACRARLRSDQVRFILLMRLSEIDGRQIERHPFFRALLAQTPTAATPHFLIYDLYAPAPSPRP